MAIEDNVKKAIKDNNKEIDKDIQKRFQQMELAIQKTLEEHNKALDQRTNQDEERWKKAQALLDSIAKRIEALEVETYKIASSLGHQTT